MLELRYVSGVLQYREGDYIQVLNVSGKKRFQTLEWLGSEWTDVPVVEKEEA